MTGLFSLIPPGFFSQIVYQLLDIPPHHRFSNPGHSVNPFNRVLIGLSKASLSPRFNALIRQYQKMETWIPVPLSGRMTKENKYRASGGAIAHRPGRRDEHRLSSL